MSLSVRDKLRGSCRSVLGRAFRMRRFLRSPAASAAEIRGRAFGSRRFVRFLAASAAEIREGIFGACLPMRFLAASAAEIRGGISAACFPMRFLAVSAMVSCAALSPLAALGRVVSPCEGSWANRQSLVLDTSDGAECFYSLSGADPSESGFAYDGPVLVDVAGSVRVRIMCVVPGGETERYDISYTVAEAEPSDAAARQFVQDAASRGVLELGAGAEVSVPKGLLVGAGSSAASPRLSVRVLRVDGENALSRFVPVCFTDGLNSWRFVAAVRARSPEPFSAASVPFSFPDWKSVSFGSAGFSWRIDGGEWRDAPARVPLDRSVRHVIEWSGGGAPSRFVVPPRPRVVAARTATGAVSFAASEEGWTLAPVSSGADGEFPAWAAAASPGERVVFDVLPGEFVSARAVFALYSGGVFMGRLAARWGIDREPPEPPVLTPSFSGSFSRDPVFVSAEAEEGAEIFVRVRVNGGEDAPFRTYAGPVVLGAKGEEVARCSVTAFARDRYGNESPRAEYSVTIDELNYPVRSFSEIRSVISGRSHAHFSVEGEMRLPPGESVIDSDCMISGGGGGARIVVPADGFLTVRGTWLQVEGCVIVKERGDPLSPGYEPRFLVADGANVSFTDSEISAEFARGGVAVEAAGSVVSLVRSGITVSASGYACAVGSSESLVTAEDSRVWVGAAGAVAFSASGGILAVSGSDCTVSPSSSGTGRVASLSDVTARLSGNTFRSLCPDPAPSRAVWKDERTMVTEDRGNVLLGFGL